MEIEENKIEEEACDYNSNRDRSSGMYMKSSVASFSFVEESHPECKFCKRQFDDINESQRENFKKNLIKKNYKEKPVENKEEEFFKMCLLSFQLKHKSKKVMALDAKKLFKEVSELEKLPFFKWNDWLKKTIERLMFEEMYKKKTEFEYAKILAKKYEVKANYF